MPAPAGLRYDPMLSAYSTELGIGDYSGEQLAPVVPVQKSAGFYPVFDRSKINTGNINPRIAGAPANRVQWGLDKAPFLCHEYPLRALVTDDEIDESEDWVDPLNTGAEVAKQQVWLDYEKRVAAAYGASGNFSNVIALGGTAFWVSASGAAAGSTRAIAQNVLRARGLVRVTAGVPPTHIVIPPLMADVMVQDPQLLTALASGGTAAVPAFAESYLRDGMLPPVMWGLKTFVPSKLQNAAADGLTAIIGDVWGGSTSTAATLSTAATVAVVYLDAKTTRRSPSFCKTFRNTKYGVGGEAVWKYREEGVHGWWVEYGLKQIVKVTVPQAGCLITGVVGT